MSPTLSNLNLLISDSINQPICIVNAGGSTIPKSHL